MNEKKIRALVSIVNGETDELDPRTIASLLRDGLIRKTKKSYRVIDAQAKALVLAYQCGLEDA